MARNCARETDDHDHAMIDVLSCCNDARRRALVDGQQRLDAQRHSLSLVVCDGNCTFLERVTKLTRQSVYPLHRRTWTSIVHVGHQIS